MSRQGCKETWEQALCLDGCLGSCTGKASPRGYLSPDLNEEAEQTMLRSGESISGRENSMCKGPHEEVVGVSQKQREG